MSDERKVVKRESPIILREDPNNPYEDLFAQGNKVFIRGIIESDFEFSYQDSNEEYFYQTRIIVERTSKKKCFIPLVVPETFLDDEVLSWSLTGKWIEVIGNLKSYAYYDHARNSHLKLFAFPSKVRIFNKKPTCLMFKNFVFLDAYICKKPIYRKTKLGKVITDLFVATNLPNGKSFYIPCIAWHEYAVLASSLNVGDKVKIYGSIQNRLYFKENSQNVADGEWKEVYEVSANKITLN